MRTYNKATCDYLEYEEFVRKNLIPKGVDSSRKLRNYIAEGGYIPDNMPRDPQWYFKRMGMYEQFSFETLFGQHKNSCNKLNINDVKFIRKQLNKNIPVAILAKQFCVSETQVKRIKSGKCWK